MPSGRSGDLTAPPTAAMLLNPKAFKSQLPKNQHPLSTSSHPSSMMQFDPRALLDPKGRSSQPSQLRSPSIPSSDAASGEKAAPKRPISTPNPLEQIYSVEDRSQVSQKRKKITSESTELDGKKTSNFVAPSSGGPIGAYMREGQSLDMNGPPMAIDLTADDDDDVVVTGERILKPVISYEDEEVCLGRIDARIDAYKIPQPPKSSFAMVDTSKWTLIPCRLHRNRGENNIVITVFDPSQVDFGRLDAGTARGLATLIDRLPGLLRLQTRIPIRSRRPGESPGQPTTQTITCSINVYAPRRLGRSIGHHLGQCNVFLNRPLGVDQGKEICNPHDDAARRGNARLSSGTGGNTGIQADNRTVEEATDAVSKMFDALSTTNENLEQMEPDPTIMTPLLEHQKQALHFLVEKEKPRSYANEDSMNSSLWRLRYRPNGQQEYREIVSGISQTKEPDQVLGGLLADMMGLGKTIEILALLASTKQEAQHFQAHRIQDINTQSRHFLCQTRATLLVVPLSTVQNWESQIREHVKPGTFHSHIYHGPNRATNAYELTKYDVVITTYGTVASEALKAGQSFEGPLYQTKWFRIVLDEAHTIREAKAKQSQAIYNIWATRHWAVTGTPIQNRIEDLGSLLRFLRLYPYDSTQGFTQHIRAPLKNPSPKVLTSLRVLIGSISLRRLKDRIELPKREDLVMKLTFTSEEQQLHDFFKSSSKAKMDVISEARQKSAGTTSLHVLQGILTLRMISACGKDLLNERDRGSIEGSSEGQPIDLDGPDKPMTIVTKSSALEMFTLMQSTGLDVCKICSKILGGDSPREEENADQSCAFVLSCYDLFCRDCFDKIRPDLEETAKAEEQGHINCPACGVDVPTTVIEITPKKLEEYQTTQEASKKRKDKTKKSYSGPSTKTTALLDDLVQMELDSQDFLEKGEPPIKAVVYSEFTSHLDLLEVALTNDNYRFVRIDGTMSLAQRRKVLNSFRDDPMVVVLLASIKAAGQGLNLTAASRVFIMEPLWNPAAEQQAVDRIHRLGQRREVTIKRYIVNDSIEEKIIELQKKKQKLADISMNREKGMSKKESQEETAKMLSEIFK